MKNSFLIIALFLSQLLFSQIPVTDATANSQLALQLGNAGKQLSQLQNTYKLMKNADEKVKQINGYVKQANHLQNIIKKQQSAIKNANEILKIAKKRKLNLNGVTTNLQMISGSIKTVQALLQNGIFNMNDNERFQRLEAEEQKVSQYENNIKVKLIQSSFR